MTAAAWMGITGAYLIGAGLTAGTILLQMATSARGVHLLWVIIWPLLWVLAIVARLVRGRVAT